MFGKDHLRLYFEEKKSTWNLVIPIRTKCIYNCLLTLLPDIGSVGAVLTPSLPLKLLIVVGHRVWSDSVTVEYRCRCAFQSVSSTGYEARWWRAGAATRRTTRCSTIATASTPTRSTQSTFFSRRRPASRRPRPDRRRAYSTTNAAASTYRTRLSWDSSSPELTSAWWTARSPTRRSTSCRVRIKPTASWRILSFECCSENVQRSLITKYQFLLHLLHRVSLYVWSTLFAVDVLKCVKCATVT